MKKLVQRFIPAIALFLFAVGVSQLHAEQATVSATLIYASNSGKGVDGSLRSLAPTLRKRFSGYDSFEVRGRRSQGLSIPGNAGVSLGGGNQVRFTAKPSGRKISIQAHWKRGNVTLQNVTFALQRGGRPSVLGVSEGDGALIMLFTVK